MKQKYINTVILFFVFLFVAMFPALSAAQSALLSPQTIEPYGLTRLWFNQVDIDSTRSKVLHAVVDGDTMIVASDDATVHAIDVLTGKSLWARSAGNREMLVQEPALNSRMVAIVNSAELFVFDRYNGKLLLQTSLPGAATVGVELSESYAYIPMMDKRIIAYPLQDTRVSWVAEDDLVEDIPTSSDSQNEPIDSAQASESGFGSGKSDPVLDNIVKRFKDAKKSVMDEKPPTPEKPQVVLREAIKIPMVCQSFGYLSAKPKLSTQILTFTDRNHIKMHHETLTWVTDTGFFLAAEINSLSQEEFTLQYRVDSSAQTYFLGANRLAKREWTQNKEIIARPTVNQCVPFLYTGNKRGSSMIPSLAVVGSLGGYIFAVRDRIGEVEWQFAANGPITEKIGVIGVDVYCPTASGGLHALDLIEGKEMWYTPSICKFIAASKERLYTIDNRSRLVILDRETGIPLHSFDVRRFDQILFNVETDRLYLVTASGLIQCLAERQQQTEEEILENKPIPEIRHRLSTKQYAEVMLGRKAPKLYWVPDEVDATESTVEQNDPFN